MSIMEMYIIKFGDVLDVSREQLPMITDEKILDKYKASFLQNGDVIIADTAEDTTVGKCSEIAGLRDEVCSVWTAYYSHIDQWKNLLLAIWDII